MQRVLHLQPLARPSGAGAGGGLPFLAVRAGWPLRILLVAVAFLLLSAAGAKAQTCTTTITDTNFGSPNLVTVAGLTTTATLSISCTSMPGGTTYACPSFGPGSGGASGTTRMMTGPGGATLNYNLYSDSARTVRWGSLTDASLGSVPRITVAKSGSLGSATATVYGGIATGQGSGQPGSYSSSFSGHVSVKMTGGTNCSTGSTLSTNTSSFDVLATPAAACTVTATGLSFGTRGVLDAVVDASSTLSVTCASGLAYSVELGDGLTGTGPAARKMTQASQSLTYGLYRDVARSLPWGGAGSAASGTGTGTAQAFTVYGRVPAQPTPSPGAYSDTVVATVVY